MRPLTTKLGKLAPKLKQLIKKPECLHCGEPIHTKYNALPHGYLHDRCEPQVECNAEKLQEKLEAFHTGVTVAGLEGAP